MNIKDTFDSLEYLFKAQLTPFLWGHAGLGKTSVVKQYAKSKGWKYFGFYLGTQSDSGDILGLADFIRDKNGNIVSTKFAPPDWVTEVIKYCLENPDSGAIIFLDEFNRGRRDLLQGMFSLCLDKTFHTMKFPSNCHFIAAGNPPTDEYVTTDVDETALMGRFAHIKFEPTFEEWVTYAKNSEYNPTIISFLQEQPQLISDNRQDFQLSTFVKVDPRAFERVNKLMKVGTPDHLLHQLMYGIIGVEKTTAYLEHLKKSDKPLSVDEFFSENGKKMITKWSNGDVKSSLLTITLENVENHLKAIDEEKQKKLTSKQAEMLIEVLELVPKDISFKFIFKVRRESPNKEFIRISEDKKYFQRVIDLLKEAKGIK